MASCYGDGCCRVWDARTWKLLGRLKGAHASPCYGAAKTDGFVASWAAEGLAFWSCEDALRKADATKKATPRSPIPRATPCLSSNARFRLPILWSAAAPAARAMPLFRRSSSTTLSRRKRGRSDDEDAGEKRPRESFFVCEFAAL